MIRPYFAVLKDSFHEAFANRILWILLVLSTIALALLAPLTVGPKPISGLTANSGVKAWSRLAGMIAHEYNAEGSSPGKHIMSLAGKSFQERIVEIAEREDPTQIDREDKNILVTGLNEVLRKPDFYDKEIFAGVTPGAKAVKYLERGPENLDDNELLYLNRELLRAAYPVSVQTVSGEQMQMYYLGFEMFDPFPVDRSIVELTIRFTMVTALQYIYGSIGIFVAILVTASIIPQTFEAGAVDLLLSKPVSRPLLYLAKFAGGCTFILLLTTYILTGLWLILGIRFGMWEAALLKCIPIFLFLFAIYYSVSAAAGVYWKNTIVCVGVTVLFWLLCFVLGITRTSIEGLALVPNEINTILPTEETMLVTTKGNEFREWQGSEWERTNSLGGGPRGAMTLLGLVHQPERQEFWYLPKLIFNNPFGMGVPPARLMRSYREGGNWKTQAGPEVPPATDWMFPGKDGELLFVATNGIYRLSPENQEEIRTGNFGDGNKRDFRNFQLPPPKLDYFEKISPTAEVNLLEPFAAAIHPDTGNIALFSSNTLSVLQRGEDGQYLTSHVSKKTNITSPATMAYAGDTIAIVEKGGTVRVLDAKTLDVRREFTPAGESDPQLTAASADGQWFAVLFHNKTLTLFDREGNNSINLDDDVSGFSFQEDGLLVADRVDRITRYQPGSWSSETRMAPDPGWVRQVNSWGFAPLYTIFPKPGQLSDVIEYLLITQPEEEKQEAEKEEKSLLSLATDLRANQEKPDIWPPILSSLGFVIFMLTATCIYVYRMDL